MVKLLKECNRLKHVLSSNKEAQFYVEGILDGIDFVSSIKKEEFEEISKPLLNNFVPLIEKVLHLANLSISDINAVELIGGGVRIPKI